MVDFEKALLKTKLEKLESELNYTTTERDNLFAQAKDERRYIRQCESTIKELEQKLETQVSMTEAYRKVTNDHHMILRQIQDMALLVMNSNYDRDQLQLVVTQFFIKIMDYGIHPPEAAIPQKVTVSPEAKERLIREHGLTENDFETTRDNDATP